MTLEEQGAIGSVLIDSAALAPLREVVRADDFADDSLRAIFTAACFLADNKRPLDCVTIACQAQVPNELVIELMDTTPTAANVVLYGREVHKAAVNRQVNKLGLSLIDSTPASVLDTISETVKALEELSSSISAKILTPTEEYMEFIAEVEKITTGQKKASVKTGFPGLDRTLGGGLVTEGLYILAARPGVGKTTFGLAIAENVAKDGDVLFVSMEMSRFQIMARRSARITGFPISVITNGDMDGDRKQKLFGKAADMTNRHLTICDKSQMSVEDIQILAMSMKTLSLVVIDYLGLIKHRAGKSLYERVTDTSNSLKRMARTLGVPVLCLAQLNRSSEGRADKKPTLSDLRDSGAIEQDADAVMLLHRPGDWKETKQLLEVNVAKNRHGATGKNDFDMYVLNGNIAEIGAY